MNAETKNVTSLLPFDAVLECLRTAYAVAVKSCTPPPDEPWIDHDGEAYADASNLIDVLEQQLAVELRKGAGLAYNEDLDIAAREVLT